MRIARLWRSAFGNAQAIARVHAPMRIIIVVVIVAAVTMLFGVGFIFAWLRLVGLSGQGNGMASESFIVEPGEGAHVIAARLEAEGLIRSARSFLFVGALTGAAWSLKPGHYELSPSMSALSILRELRDGAAREVTVTIPEGATARDIDALLAAVGVTREGEIRALAVKRNLEGKLFPDTYRFFATTAPEEVITRLVQTFEQKAVPILLSEPQRAYENLILASLIEKEVPDPDERRIVAGILKKRLAADMPLQVDAAICYVKPEPCHPLTGLDLTIDSPYNTYIHKGLPPGPIANPGEDALRAAVGPVASSYWFYLSDPKTAKTIFARTLDEHRQNRVNYLNQ